MTTEPRALFECALPGCSGLNSDGTCPNGYGVTCEAEPHEPSDDLISQGIQNAWLEGRAE